MTGVAEDKIKLTFIFPKRLKAQFDAMAKIKNVSKTSVILFQVEKWMRDECIKMNIDINELTSDTDINRPPKIDFNEKDDPWF